MTECSWKESYRALKKGKGKKKQGRNAKSLREKKNPITIDQDGFGRKSHSLTHEHAISKTEMQIFRAKHFHISIIYTLLHAWSARVTVRNARSTCGRGRSICMPITFHNLQLMNEVIKIAVVEMDYICRDCNNTARRGSKHRNLRIHLSRDSSPTIVSFMRFKMHSWV